MNELSRPFKEGTLRLRYLWLGKDLQVIMSGGREHIGAVALARYPGPSNVSQISVPGHREEELAVKTALRLSEAMQCTVAVSAGIHFDNLSKTEIEKIRQTVDEMLSEMLLKLR